MSTLTAKDLRGNEPAELRNTIKKLQEDLFKNRMKSVTNQLENTMLLRHARRDIARVNTVLSEKARAAGVTAPAAKSQAKAATSAKAATTPGSKSPKAAPAGKSGKASSGSKEE
jgi:large subunit ribosomal protein L29